MKSLTSLLSIICGTLLMQSSVARPDGIDQLKMDLRSQRKVSQSRKMSLVIMTVLFVAHGGVAFSQTSDDKDWCSRCFVFNGEDQFSSSAFDMKFRNNCGISIDFYYWRQAGKDGMPTNRRQVTFVQPGVHAVRCNGSRTWICTPITSYEWTCPKRTSAAPKTKGSTKTASSDNKNDFAARLRNAERRAANAKEATHGRQDEILANFNREQKGREADRLAAEKNEVAERERKDRENRESVRQQIPKEESVIPATKFPSLAKDIAISAAYWVGRNDCKSGPDGITCYVPRPLGQVFDSKRPGCYDIREYALRASTGIISGGQRVDIICIKMSPP